MREIVLTPRQREVVTLLAAGCTCRQIAYRLNIAEGTVRKHIEDIAGKVPGDQLPIRRITMHAKELLTSGMVHVELRNFANRRAR